MTGLPDARPPLLTAAGLSERLPSRPVLTSPAEWDGVVLERYRHPPSIIDVAGLGQALVVDHLAGPVLVEDGLGGPHHERRWTGPGQVSVTPAGQPVHRALRGRPDVVLVCLAPALLRAAAEGFEGLDPENALVSCFATPDRTADHLVRLLLSEAESPGPATVLMADALGRALAVHLLRHHSAAAPRPAGPAPTIATPRLRRVIERMRSSLDEELTLTRLAALGGLSPSQFARAFRRATGQSPHRYLVGLRLEEARRLLDTSDLPVTEVGLRCGFGQPSHFSTAFRQATGHSPRAWRQLRRT